MIEEIKKTVTKKEESVEDIFSNKSESNNSRFDVPGNMTTWRTHETYNGTGNHNSMWDDLHKEKRKELKAAKLLKKILNDNNAE